MPKGPLVAIVDDDESIRDTTKDLLESAGFSAAVYACAASLLKSGRLSQVRCLITDVCMPQMSGLELHRRLVTLGRTVPTIFVTAYPDERAEAQAIKSGLVYLIKPVAADELLGYVRSALQARGGGDK